MGTHEQSRHRRTCLRRFILTGVLIVLFALPAAAHTRAELDEWRADWVQRADVSLSAELFDEWTDMADRHPWYFDEKPQDALYAGSSHSGRNSSGMGSGGPQVEQWRPLVVVYFAAADVPTAMCLIAAESGGNPDAKNPSSSAAGLFQFLRGTWNSVPASVTGGSYDSGQVYNPEANIRSAAWLKSAAGWTQWSPYKRGACR